MTVLCDLNRLTGLEIYPASLAAAGETTYFLGRRDGQKWVGAIGPSRLIGSPAGQSDDGKPVLIGPTDAFNAGVIRSALPWTAPRLVGPVTSAGLGDRLGLATPGHVRAIRRHGNGVTPVFAQQSIREMTRTGRTPLEVMDAATWGVFQEGYAGGFGSDADHLQRLEDVESTAAAGFTMFTIDPGQHVENHADEMIPAQLADRFARLEFSLLEISARDLESAYQGRTFPLPGGVEVSFPSATFLRAAVKYGRAIAHAVRMYRHLVGVAAGETELEISVDETQTPTTPAEHYFFAAELARMGVKWVSLAPRLVGRFEKGVDYIGDPAELRRTFAQHVAVARGCGDYKLSIHSGSDKFSVYALLAELAGGKIHLKTAGTSYLEALRATAMIEPPLLREILDFARSRYETDKASYHVSADVSKVPPAASVNDRDLPALLEDFHARQVLHVTYGSVLTAEQGKRFREPLYAALRAHEDVYYEVLEAHLGRHVAPLAR